MRILGMRKVGLWCACLLLTALAARAADWPPVNAEELALKHSKTDPGADAEALIREVRILNERASFSYPRDIRNEYIRLKIFTARGKDKYGNVEIPYYGQTQISGVEGRTIKPDGTIVELNKDAIFYKDVVRKNGLKVRVVSFAMPGVEPGAIVEYRWRADYGDALMRFIPLDVQSEFPTDELIFHVKPASSTQWLHMPEMHYIPFGCKIDSVKHDIEGFETITLHNIPAFHEEPYMPPDDVVKQWVLLYYEENTNAGTSPDKFWTSLGHELYREYNLRIKINDDVRSIVSQVTAGATSDDEKLARLAEYCRKNIKDVHGDEITTQQREQAKERWTTVDILRQGSGTQEDIRLAFIALAQAAGFEARMAYLSTRDFFFFNPKFTTTYFLNGIVVAVNVAGQWKFYDVTNHAVPPGQLPWTMQGVNALITGSKAAFSMTPELGAKDNKIQHGGSFTLSPDGTLEGVAREVLWGNFASDWRTRFGRQNDAEREKAVRDELKQYFGDFDATNIRVTSSTDASKPVGIAYNIVVRNYAARTAKRLFLTPAYFQYGHAARFVDNSREHPIYFSYPWSEEDFIDIQLPKGYQLDHPDAPSSLQFGPAGSYSARLYLTKDGKLLYRREFVFGGDSSILYEARAYPQIKAAFDRIHTADAHVMTLISEPPSSSQIH